jgi:hypothetical protein
MIPIACFKHSDPGTQREFFHRLYCTTFPLGLFGNLIGSKEIAIMLILLVRGVEQVLHIHSPSLTPSTVKIHKDQFSTK